MNTVDSAREVFNKEIGVLEYSRDHLDDTFDEMLSAIMNCKGKVIWIGMGKSGHVARKIAASMASLGTCAICLHPGECMHGDLGMIQEQDVVVLISYSGESDEILRIIPSIHIIGAKILGITCNRDSTLARSCDVVQIFDNVSEACHLGLAPTSSTTLVMVYGDALAVTASKMKGFDKDDFGVFHPAGSLGKRLTIRSVDLMRPVDKSNHIRKTTRLIDALIALSESDVDILDVVNDDDKLIGVVTNGDLKRRMKGSKTDIYEEVIGAEYHAFPYYVDNSSMAIDALRIMLKNKVHSITVVNADRPIGVIRQQDILDSGIYV